MITFVRRSLLTQLLGVYLVLVLIVIGSGVEIDALGQRQLRDQLQNTDVSLAQEVAFDTYTTISQTATSLIQMEWSVAGAASDPTAMENMFATFMAGRPDIDHMYWLDADGILRASAPKNLHTLGANFGDTPLFQVVQPSYAPVVQGGTVDPTTAHDVVTVAEAVHGSHGNFLGMLAVSLLLDSLSQPLGMVAAAQTLQGQHVTISLLDENGFLIGSPDPAHSHMLQRVVQRLPGAAEALAGATVTYEAPGPGGGTWRYSAVPVPAVDWAVVVQQPLSDLNMVTSSFTLWLFVATGLFGLGGIIFWLLLFTRVVQPLHRLAAPLASLAEAPARFRAFTRRGDEVGGLARALDQLSHDVTAQLGELHTLLETSNAVVNSLDPRAVGETIIREVRRLVDVQAAAVLVPDEEGVLRVLASVGRADDYESRVHVRPEHLTVPSARALHERRPVQMIDDGSSSDFPPVSAEEGFHAILAVPILSQHVGNVVLVVHRREPQPFSASEVDLVLTFANYATLAWEHAVLYERSDERLREVARENERLYREADAEKRTLAAIIGSIRDGLLLAGTDGVVLYANPGARALIGETEATEAALESLTIEDVHARLSTMVSSPEQYTQDLARAEAGEIDQWVVETTGDEPRSLQMRLFGVRDDAGRQIGHGMLLRDVTREQELDRFKTTLLAAVGHELRTPLASIKGHASTLLQEDVTWPVEEQRHFLRTISREADGLARLVSNLLDLARSDAGLLSIRREPADLGALVRAVARRLEADGASIALDLPPDLPDLEIDAGRIEVVLHNLLVNARKYGGGRINVTAHTRGDRVVVRVSDDGPGVSPDDAPHIFERFYRAQHALIQHIGGTGLGLAICKAFVEAHGGAIWVEPRTAGTCIAFELPAAGSSMPAAAGLAARSGA